MTAVPLAELLEAAALSSPLLLALAVLAGAALWTRPAVLVALSVGLVAVPLRSGGEDAALAHFTPPDLAAAALCAVVGLRAVLVGGRSGASAAAKLASWVVLPLLAVLVVGAAAAVFADDVVGGIAGWVRLAQIFVVVPVATFLALEEERDLWLVLGTVVVVGLLEGTLGIYQFATGTGAVYGTVTRAVGTFGAYEIMAMATIVTYALIASAALAWGGATPRARLIGAACALALLPPLAFSFSRGAWISAVVGLLVVAALAGRRALLSVLVTGILLAAALLAVGASGTSAASPLAHRVESITSSLGEGADQSVGDRYALWKASRSMLEERPFLGVGPKNFALHRDEHAPLDFSGGSDITDPEGGYRRVELLTPHSLYWLILAEQGFAGGLAYGSLFASLALASLARLRGAGGAPRRLGNGLESGGTRAFALAASGWLAAYLMRSVYGDLGGSLMVVDSVMIGCLLWVASGSRAADAQDGNAWAGGRLGAAAAAPEREVVA